MTPLVALMLAPAGAVSSENSSRCGGVLGSLARLVTHRFCPAIKLVFVSAASTGGGGGGGATTLKVTLLLATPPPQYATVWLVSKADLPRTQRRLEHRQLRQFPVEPRRELLGDCACAPKRTGKLWFRFQASFAWLPASTPLK